jgi:NAD-dependent dihydropyrimidine dehydrogenase PreA subunit
LNNSSPHVIVQMPAKQPSIFDLMNEESECQVEDKEEERRQRRKELLEPTGVNDLFKEGKIAINPFTCVGAQCRLCIKACPTNALYWGTGKVEVIEDMCVYCGACVFNCMVDNCINIQRTRQDGKVEKFSKPSDVVKLAERLNNQKRFQRVKTNASTMRRYKEKDICNRQLFLESQAVGLEETGPKKTKPDSNADKQKH